MSARAHALPWCAASTLASSGQRGLAAKVMSSVRPSDSRSIPAQAIIAPLSVQSWGGGRTSRSPLSPQNRPKARRIGPLAATPPATTMALAWPTDSPNRRKPARERSMIVSTTAAWNEAHRFGSPKNDPFHYPAGTPVDRDEGNADRLARGGPGATGGGGRSLGNPANSEA